ncbi:hypothetical protein RF11_16524 [Thelohanellus kitauei]|uniref:Serpin domain-containing protein n=1 Tax=Thelohanellus kitauei TaxID=669202 RepID=A0A0C2I5Q4_THEKT|nr:hypothetical protein RF11_16524 [Thelohanellus kitauei]
MEHRNRHNMHITVEDLMKSILEIESKAEDRINKSQDKYQFYFNQDVVQESFKPEDNKGNRKTIHYDRLKHHPIEEKYNRTPLERRNIKIPSENKEFCDINLPRFGGWEKFIHFDVTDVFEDSRSDFGSMTNQTIFIRNLVQVAHLSVDKFGVTATAATVAIADNSIDDIMEFYVTRPFLFFIYCSSKRLALLAL